MYRVEVDIASSINSRGGMIMKLERYRETQSMRYARGFGSASSRINMVYSQIRSVNIQGKRSLNESKN